MQRCLSTSQWNGEDPTAFLALSLVSVFATGLGPGEALGPSPGMHPQKGGSLGCFQQITSRSVCQRHSPFCAQGGCEASDKTFCLAKLSD